MTKTQTQMGDGLHVCKLCGGQTNHYEMVEYPELGVKPFKYYIHDYNCQEVEN